MEETKNAVTSPSAREFTEMSTSLAVKKETEVWLAKQTEANLSVTTREGTRSLSMTLQQATSFPSTSAQGQWTSMTNELPPTLHQKMNAKHESLVLIAGNSVSLQCASSVDATFRWNYWSLGIRRPVRIYSRNRLYRALPLTASLSVSSCGTRNCALTVSGIQLGDTGVLACLGGAVDKYWSFTILGKYIQTGIVTTQSLLQSDSSSKCMLYCLYNFISTFFLFFIIPALST